MDQDAIYPPRENQIRQPSALIHSPLDVMMVMGDKGAPQPILGPGLGSALSVSGYEKETDCPVSCLPS